MSDEELNRSLNRMDDLLLNMTKNLVRLEYYISIIEFDNLEKHSKNLKLILENEKDINYLS